MGFWKQLSFLLWKNFLLRRRQKVWSAVELIWPLVLFLILVWVRTRDLTEKRPYCHYNAKAMPSTGLSPFIQSYICTLQNNCSQVPTTDGDVGIVGKEEQSILGLSVRALEALFNSTSELKSVESLLEVGGSILKLLAPLRPSKKADLGILVRSLFKPENRGDFVDLLMRSNIPSSAARAFMESTLTPRFFALETAIVYSSGAQFGGPNVEFYEETRQRIFCDEKVLAATVKTNNTEAWNTIQRDFCHKWNTTIFAQGSSGILGWLDMKESISALKLAVNNVTGYDLSVKDMMRLGFLVWQLEGDLSNPELRGVLQKFLNITEPFRNTSPNASVAALTCGGSYQDWEKAFDSGSTFQQIRDKYQTRKEERVERQKFKWEEEGGGEQEALLSGDNATHPSTPFPHIRNSTHKIVCGGIPIDKDKATKCWDMLGNIGFPDAFRVQIFSLLQGFILVTPIDTPAVQAIMSQLRVFLDSLGVIRDTLSDFYYNADAYQEALLVSDVGKGIKVIESVVEDLNATGILSAALSKNETRAVLRALSIGKELLMDPSDSNATVYRLKQMLKPAVEFLECFRTERFIPIDSEYGMEVLGTCLIDYFLYFSGLVFQTEEGAESLSPLTTYKIRMANFLVDGPRIMDRIWNPRPRDRAFIDQKYLYFGFSFLQDAVDRAIIHAHTNSSTRTGVFAQEFPSPCYMIDVFERVLSGMMPLFMTLSWVFTAALIVKNIVYEKERRLKEVMKVMGLSNFVHWAAWFIQTFSFALVSIFILTILLKVGRVTEMSDPTVLFVFLMLFAIATITQCFFISTLFSRANLAAACGAVVYFLLYIPYATLRPRAETLGYNTKAFSCVLSQVAFGWGCASLAGWEEEGSGVQWSNIRQSPVVFEEFNFLTAMLMLVGDTFVHILLTWYIEAVFPGQYGIALPWYFPVMKTYWCGDWKSGGVEVDVGEEGGRGPERDKLEAEPRDLSLGVSIRNLRKVYSNGKVAVDGLSLNFYEGQITSFLGHNGAGKTTTMSILTGLYPPSEGTAMIYGRDIRREFNEIRKSVGMCPQHNVLFDDLTVKEQLTFYAGLKGVEREEMKKEVEKNILDVDLHTKKDELAKDLSGGMQRKLSIAVAFIGGSKTVILDEPTAGVDPYARRGIWDLLNGYRKGRTIILSTHHMDEADILGDRIAIISQGRLQCCGSSIFLKKRFGTGYHLTLVKGPWMGPHTHGDTDGRKGDGPLEELIPLSKLHHPMNNGVVAGGKKEVPFPAGGGGSTSSTSVCSSLSGSGGSLAPRPPGDGGSEGVVSFIKTRIPGAVLREDFGSELIFNLPSSEPKVLESFFEDLDGRVGELGVTAYGVSDTTLEEIFLQMVGQEGGEDFQRIAACDCCPSLRRKLRIRFGGRTRARSVPVQAGDDRDLVDSEDEMEGVANGAESSSHPKISVRQRGESWLMRRRVRALLTKRFHNFRRNLKGAFAEILLPVVLVALTMLLLKVLPTNPENPPPLLLTPWLYGTPTQPNVIFFSSDKISPDGNKRGEKIVESFLDPPGLGVRCMDESPFKDRYKCQKRREEWSGALYHGNYTVPDWMCGCNKASEYVCAMDAYQPLPPRILLNTTDIMLNMTGRNISQWILMTEKKYRKQRFGGFSLGEVNRLALKNESLTRIQAGIKEFGDFLEELSANLSINWNIGNNDSVEEDREYRRSGQELRNILSGLDVQNNVKVWFNNQGWAALPAYMNTLSNSILRSLLPSGLDPSRYGIVTYNHPMNYSKGQQIGSIEGGMRAGPRESFEAVMVILAFSVVPASFVLFVIDERVTHSKHLQFVSGVGPVLYWITNLIWDMLNFLIPVILCMCLFFGFGVESLVGDVKTALATLILFITYGFAIVPVMYSFTFVFRVPSLAFITLAIGNFFLGVVSTLTTATLEVLGQSDGDQDLLTINGWCKKTFLLLPQYCLGRGILDLKISYLYYSSIKRIFGSARVPDPFAWDQIGRNLVCMVAQGIAGFILVLLIEHRYILNKCSSKKSRERAGSRSQEEEEDSDVAEERLRVLSGGADQSPLCISSLSKVYSRGGGCGGGRETAAVDNLCLGIKSGECFGLLGVNGAGKTTTFKMLTGKTTISKGDASFNGLSVKRDLHRVHQMIGYCPQFDALHGLLTGREQLAFYARLRGIEEHDIPRVVSWALSHMHLRSQGSQLTRNYSGGNKRKLSTALALLGNPSVVLLDEPTTGMDPKARRFLWNRITDIVREDRCVVLTSHSMEECETLCNRIAIMVSGKMKCLGSVQHLKNKFGDGYTLSMILYERSGESVERAVGFVESEFPGSVLKERHRGMLQFRLPARGVRLPKIFAVIQEARERLKLEDYALSQTTLDQVFIGFAEQQEEGPPALNPGTAEIRHGGRDGNDLLTAPVPAHAESEGEDTLRPATTSQISPTLLQDPSDQVPVTSEHTRF